MRYGLSKWIGTKEVPHTKNGRLQIVLYSIGTLLSIIQINLSSKIKKFMNSIKILSFLLLFTLPFLLINCNDSTGAQNQTGTLEVLLHDAPANYEEVNVFIDRVEVNKTNSEEGWIVINNPQKSYNLLELTNGATELLGSAELEVGNYEQIRLILSRNGNNIVVGGVTQDLFIPSGTQTGIKLLVNAEILADITYTILLDFDVARSVVERGNAQAGAQYLLKPVIKATNQAITGNISGVVEPVDAADFIYAIAGADTISSTKADTLNGSYTLIGLEEGSYTVSFDPTNTVYQSQDTTSVQVTVSETNDIGTVILLEN